MKKILFIITFCHCACLSLASNKDFTYDKILLAQEFIDVNEANCWIETTDASYLDFQSNHYLYRKINLSNHIAVQPNFSFEEMEWLSFAWGLCCCPIGFFVVTLDKDSSKEDKTSFWIGVLAGIIISVGPSASYYVY